MVTSDCSERTLRHTKAACKGELLQLPLTQHEIAAAIGVRFVTAAVQDENLMQLIRLSVNEEA